MSFRGDKSVELATTVTSAWSAAAPARVTGSHGLGPKSKVPAPLPAPSVATAREISRD